MSLGAVELAFVLILSLIAVPFAIKTHQKWISAVPAFFLAAALTSPADVVSTLIVGIANTAVFALAYWWLIAGRTVNGGKVT